MDSDACKEASVNVQFAFAVCNSFFNCGFIIKYYLYEIIKKSLGSIVANYYL